MKARILSQRLENQFALSLCGLIGIYYLLLWIQQEAIVDIADGVLHYQYARFMLHHEELAFNQWAKPIFTLLAYLPAQLGLKAVSALDAFYLVLACWFSFRSAQKLKLKFAYLVPLFVGLGNSIFNVMLSGLTEPLMMFAFSLVIYMAIQERFKAMFVLLAAMLLIRPEAVVIIPVFGLYGIVRGSWWNALHFLWIPVLYSFLGVWIANFDFLWIFTHQPYGDIGPIYGNGSWSHYIRNWGRISTYTVLLLSGMSFVKLFRQYRRSLIHWAIFVSGFGIILLHVILWRFGWMGSAGLVRTLVTSLPALGILAILGLEQLPVKRFRFVVFLIVGLHIIEVGHFNRFPLGMYPQEKLAREMAKTIEDKGFIAEGRKIAYQFATTAYYLDLDPFDSTQTVRLWTLSDPTAKNNRLRTGDIFVWDNITGHREGGFPWEEVLGDSTLVRLDSLGSPSGKAIVSFIKR